MMMTNNAALLRKFLDVVWNRGDASSLDEFLAPAYEIRRDPGDPWEGKTLSIKEFAERLRISRAPFPDQRFEIVDLFDGGDRIFVAWNWRGTHKGDLPGFPATDKIITMSGATVYYLEDSKLCGHWQVADRLGVMQQLSAGR